MLVTGGILTLVLILFSPVTSIATINEDDEGQDGAQKYLKAPSNQFKRSFSAMRGKKSFQQFPNISPDDSMSKRPFSAMRGKKDYDFSDHKRSFSAMRGKKDFSTKRAFSAMRGKKEDSSNRFQALRGKKNSEFDLYRQYIINKQLGNDEIPWLPSESGNIILGRSKRSIRSRSSLMQDLKGQFGGFSTFLDMRIKESLLEALRNAVEHGIYNQDSEEMTLVENKRPSFVPLRGKKSKKVSASSGVKYPNEDWLESLSNSRGNEFGDDFDDESPLTDFLFKRDVPTSRPIGFISMRGKRSIE